MPHPPRPPCNEPPRAIASLPHPPPRLRLQATDAGVEEVLKPRVEHFDSRLDTILAKLTAISEMQHQAILTELSEHRRLIEDAIASGTNAVPTQVNGLVPSVATDTPSFTDVQLSLRHCVTFGGEQQIIEVLDEDEYSEQVTDSVDVENGSGSLQAAQKLSRLRHIASKRRAIIPSEATITIIDPTKSIASLLGVKSACERCLHIHSFQSHMFVGKVFFGCWWLGLLCGLFGQLTVVPNWIVYFSVLQLPLSLSAMLVLCVDIVALVQKEFETYFVLLMQVSLCGSIMMLLWDVRIIFWVCHVPNIILTAFLDAYPARYRASFLRVFVSGCVFAIIYSNMVLCFGFAGELRDRSWSFGTFRGFLSSSIGSTTAALLLYYGRHLVAALCRPKELVILMKPMRSVHIDISKLDLEALQCGACPSEPMFKQGGR